MSINFNELGINNLHENVSFKWNDKDITVLKKLSTDDKYDIVMTTLQQAEENGYYNPILLDMFYHLNLIYIYTDIIFDEEDRKVPAETYDKIKDSGLLNEFLKTINEEDYEDMLNAINEIKSVKEKYDRSAASVVKKFIDDLPSNAKTAMEIVDQFNPNNYQAMQDFAKAANGGRELPETVE